MACSHIGARLALKGTLRRAMRGLNMFSRNRRASPRSQYSGVSESQLKPNIKAGVICNKIHITSLALDINSGDHAGIPIRSDRVFDQETLILELGDRDGYAFAAYFSYGAVVYVNCDEEMQRQATILAENHLQWRVEVPWFDEYRVEVDSKLEAWSTMVPDRIILSKLNAENVRVISSVLAQSSGLGLLEAKMRRLFEAFEQLQSNVTAKSRGFFFSLANEKSASMYRMLAESGDIMTEAIVKIGLLDPPMSRMRETAWKFNRYDVLLQAMQEEFELSSRWDTLASKNNILQQRLEFFMGEINDRKGHRLERIIVYLICLECLLSCGLGDLVASQCSSLWSGIHSSG